MLHLGVAPGADASLGATAALLSPTIIFMSPQIPSHWACSDVEKIV